MKNPKICRGVNCKVDYPHYHIQDDLSNNRWLPAIDDPVISAPWPDRLQWSRSDNSNGSLYNLFKFGWFVSHSKFQLPWKLDLENGLNIDDWEAIASIISCKFAFRAVYGIPKGGTQLARILNHYCEPRYPVLIVDDVLTTGRSMIEARAQLGLLNEPTIGVVVVARGLAPNWVWPILTVNEWAQSRGTGLS